MDTLTAKDLVNVRPRFPLVRQILCCLSLERKYALFEELMEWNRGSSAAGSVGEKEKNLAPHIPSAQGRKRRRSERSRSSGRDDESDDGGCSAGDVDAGGPATKRLKDGGENVASKRKRKTLYVENAVGENCPRYIKCPKDLQSRTAGSFSYKMHATAALGFGPTAVTGILLCAAKMHAEKSKRHTMITRIFFNAI